MKRKHILLLTLFVLFGTTAVSAQSTEEDNVAFIYATGERTDGKLKVLLIGTHIMGFRGFNTAANNDINVKYSLGFSEVLDDIESKENVIHFADYDNILFNSPVLEDITTYIHPTSRVKYNINSEDSKLAALEKIRRGVIDEYRSNGYIIYQVAFDPTDYNDFEHYKDESWLPLEYVKRSAISPLWIPYYQQGEIRAMVASLGDLNSGNSGITVESKSSSTTSSSSDDADRRQRQAALARFNAGLVESEANRLYDMGSLFYPQALEKYKEANSIFPSEHSQARIRYIESLYAFGDALNSIGESLEDAVNSLDPKGKTSFAYGYVNYTGVALDQSNHFIDPSVFSSNFGFTIHRLFMSLDLKMGYMASPVYEYNLNKKNGGSFQDVPTGETVRVQQMSLNMSMGGGINIPLKYFLLYGLYGADLMMFPLSANYFSDGIKHSGDIPVFPSVNWKTTIATIVNIPKTKLAIGVQFNLNKMKGDTKDTGSRILKDSDPDTLYYLGTTTDAEYKYQNLGVSFLWKL